jgi:hypothetical protein
LDIGTYYGLFPCEAVRRGATRVVGIEMDSERFNIALKIAEFYGNSYTIINVFVGLLGHAPPWLLRMFHMQTNNRRGRFVNDSNNLHISNFINKITETCQHTPR